LSNFDYLCEKIIMAQVRLKNNTSGTSIVGSLVKLDPANAAAFVYVTDLKTLPCIGTVATTTPRGNIALINLINEGTGSGGGGNSYMPSGW
jgi:hypothetical protein